MKRFLLMLVCWLGAVGLTHAADITREFSVEPGGLLYVELETGGSIDIRGWDEPKATVEIEVYRGDPDNFTFDIRPTRSGVRIESDYRRRVRETNIEVRVMVPRRYDLDLETAGGSIAIQGISGDIEGASGGGTLKLRDLAGEIDLSTGGGAVTVRDCRLDGRVTTGGGPVTVENVEGDFDAKSGGGNVTFSNVKTPTRDYPAGQVYIRNAGGEIRVDDAPRGADVATGGGDIYVRSAANYVEAVTGGGDIEIASASGRVNATTGAGDIDVTVVRDPDGKDGDIILLTGHGDITVTVPSSRSMAVDIELAFTRGHEGEYDIVSDFDLNRETTTEWERDHGTPRKYIYGTATINDGRHRVKIRNVNGHVHLKRGE